jgi:hypothetical protein
MTTLDDQTRELVLSHLSGEMALDDFRRQFMPIAWGLDSELAASINPATSKVSLYVAEYGRGDRDDDELRELLSRAVSTVVIFAGDPVAKMTATTTQETRSVQYPTLSVVGIGA